MAKSEAGTGPGAGLARELRRDAEARVVFLKGLRRCQREVCRGGALLRVCVWEGQTGARGDDRTAADERQSTRKTKVPEETTTG